MWAQPFIVYVLLARGVLPENRSAGRCQYSCGTEFPHTMCMSEGTARKCENLKLTPARQLKEEILVWHNLFRNEVAGGKTAGRYVPNMQKMYWDDELEKMARIWASQCEPANDRCRKLPRFEVGQNVGLMVGEKPPESSLHTFTHWVNPGKIKKAYFLLPDLIRSHPKSGRKEVLKKFFQVIWPDTYLLGCAEATYRRNGLSHRLLVCNYGPSAFDRKTFEAVLSFSKGPCSRCPQRTECPRSQSNPFSNLCATGSISSQRRAILNYSSCSSINNDLNHFEVPSYETKPGEASRIDSARRTLLQLQKNAGTEILQAGRGLEVSGGKNKNVKSKNKHFKGLAGEYEGVKISGKAKPRGKSEYGSKSKNEKNKYCSIKCNGQMHMMCQKRKPNKFCRERKLISESETKNYMVKKFNEIRNHVAGGKTPHFPTASNMRILVWDKELAKLAATWAQECPSQQDGCRDVERFQVNQIVSMSVSSINNNRSLAFMSFENIMKTAESFPVNIIDTYNMPKRASSSNSLLSQILWANTSRVGCAEVLYVLRASPPTAERHSSDQYSSLVCNFGEGGNVSGGRIYKFGKPCSQCTKGTSCSSKALPYLCV